MRPELKKALEERLAELEPVQESLWAVVMKAEEDRKPLQLLVEKAQKEWNQAYQEVQWIKRKLGGKET